MELNGKYFIVGVGEEWQPVFSLIEDFREKEKVGGILFGGGDLDTSEFNSVAVNMLWLWIIIGWYFLGGR